MFLTCIEDWAWPEGTNLQFQPPHLGAKIFQLQLKFFFLEYAGELRIIALIERIERGIESRYRTHTHTTYKLTKDHRLSWRKHDPQH
jgi:hypothetical protein